MSGRECCSATIRGLDLDGPVHVVRSPWHSAEMSVRMTTYFYVKNDNSPRANIQFIFALPLRDSLKLRTRRRLIGLARVCVAQASRPRDWHWLRGRRMQFRCRKAFVIAVR